MFNVNVNVEVLGVAICSMIKLFVLFEEKKNFPPVNKFLKLFINLFDLDFVQCIVADPYVFCPLGSGSGSGSGSFYHQAKIVRKTLIPTAL
jgi:hypothetical protein